MAATFFSLRSLRSRAVVLEVLRAPQHARHEQHRAAPHLHGGEPARVRGHLARLAPAPGEQPEGGRGVVVSPALRDEQEVALGGERDGGLALLAAGEAAGGTLTGRVHLPEVRHPGGGVLVERAHADHHAAAVGGGGERGGAGEGDVVVERGERGAAHSRPSSRGMSMERKGPGAACSCQMRSATSSRVYLSFGMDPGITSCATRTPSSSSASCSISP